MKQERSMHTKNYPANWEGPYRVVEDLDNGAYQWEYLDNKIDQHS